jgi:hypothetical protein
MIKGNSNVLPVAEAQRLNDSTVHQVDTNLIL